MSLWELIKSDLSRISSSTGFFDFLKWYFFPKGSTFPHTVWFRVLQNCKKSRIKKYTIGILAYLKERQLSFKYGIYANSNIEIGSGLRVVHADGVFLNCESIGENFTVYPGVMLGSARTNSSKEGVPIIGNNVTIYTGAVVTGKVTLHDNCVVGANAFVNKDVAANTIVAGLPAKVIGTVHSDDERNTNSMGEK